MTLKNLFLFSFLLILNFVGYAQKRAPKLDTTQKIVLPVPIDSSLRTQNTYRGRDVIKMVKPMPSSLTGKYKYSWTLKDGTKVSSEFKIHEGIAAPAPLLNPGSKSGGIKTLERNEQDASSDNDWDCITKEIKITLDNDEFLTVDNLDQAANIYPGAIYSFQNYVSGSWLSENGTRNPITLSTPARSINGQSYVTIEDPNAYTIRDGINTLTNRFTTLPAAMANGAFKMKSTEVFSQADASLKIGASGSGFGFAASYLFNFNTSEQKKYFLIDCTQELFTIDTQVPENGFFQTAGQATPDMMFIGSVTYGVRVLASIETTITNKDVAHKFNASYTGLVAGGSVELDSYMKNVGEQTTIKMYVVGGPLQGVYPAFNKAELINVIQGIFKTGTYASAQPIKYTLRNLEGGVVMSQSATDFFTTRSCTPKPEVANVPDINYTVKLASLSRGNDSDWEPYGQIWTQVFDRNHNEIYAIRGGDRLMSIDASNHLNTNDSGYQPKGEVTFRLNAQQQQGAVMLIWYWLNDYDGGSGDDFLSMREGRKIRYNKNGLDYFCRLVYLDQLKPGSQTANQFFTDDFTDKDGDSFTQVAGNVSCGY